jgi:hypothetical protein
MKKTRGVMWLPALSRSLAYFPHWKRSLCRAYFWSAIAFARNHEPARRYLNLAFFTEYVRDIPVRPTAATELTDEIAVRSTAGARPSVGQAVKDFFEFGIHGHGPSLPLLYLKTHEQSLDKHLIDT